MKKKACVFGLCMVLSVVSLFFPVFAQTDDAVPIEDNGEIPAWVSRVSYGVTVETDKKPQVYMETVQPLYQSPDKVDTIFTHDRILLQNERGVYAFGIGYRRLLLDETLMAGINTFFDYQDLHQHYRQGCGIELISGTLEFRANAYFGLSGKRLIEETGTLKTYERAVNGGDVELGGPVPHVPWLKLFGSFYRYDFREFSNMRGWKARGQITPVKGITMNFEVYDDNKGSEEYRADLRYSFCFDSLSIKNIFAGFKPSQESYPAVNLKERTLDRVERNFNIQVEKTQNRSGLTVEVGRQ